jgi:hypothetical protein
LSKRALGLAEFSLASSQSRIVICSRQSVVELDLARALRELTMFRIRTARD